MKTPPNTNSGRRRVLLVGLVLASAVLVARAAQLQLKQGKDWTERANDQHSELDTLPAPRGTIYDRNNVPLAASRESFRIAVAPREVSDRETAEHLLHNVIGLQPAEVKRILMGGKRWVVLHGRFDASVRGQLQGERGFYFERVMERFYPHGSLAMELIGGVSVDGRSVSGVEKQFDALLKGKPGVAVARRDAHGNTIPGAMMSAVQPVPGQDVVLTIDHDLQEIAETALREALMQTGAQGGELVLTDPRTGEVLAAASSRGQKALQWLAVTEPYEPGSTAKPFFVASLLSEGAASLEDSVYAEQGHYEKDGRKIADTHPMGWLTVRDALRFSSNIAMVKLSDRLNAPAQYRHLRDFGFGTPTGVTYPKESSGILRRPNNWSRYSQGSLAIGYEVSVTPLQMAMAYGAIANGGTLMEPRLVKEVRSRDGRIITAYRPRSVRRVIPAKVAAQLREALRGVVEGGTGTQAALGPYNVAGKTGTARMFQGGHYEVGAYAALFAGFFPAENPQIVFLAKLDRPQGVYYGGAAAAPVTRAVLEAALAARSTSLDRFAVARHATPAAPIPAATTEKKQPTRTTLLSLASVRVHRPVVDSVVTRRIPDVAGFTVRDAAMRLHAEGFQVRISGGGIIHESRPAAGSVTPLHTIVEVVAEGTPQ